MTVIWDEDLEKIYNKLEKIDVKDIECGTVRFITYSKKVLWAHRVILQC